MIMNDRNLLLVIIASVMALLTCSAGPDLAGGGTDVSNPRVIGVIELPTGQAASNALVRLIPADYDPITDPTLSDSLIDTTDSSGAYRCNIPAPGKYNIESYHNETGLRLLIRGIMVDTMNDTLSPAILQRTGALRVVLSPATDTINGYVFVSGTTIARSLRGSTGSITLDSVPLGTLPALCYSSENTTGEPQVLRDSVSVSSADTVTVVYGSWRHTRRVYLNTTVTGAGITGDVLDFPVLVRLTNENFKFAEALSGGKDIYMTKADETVIPFEIERWDSANGQAEIWVKIDTVYGNNDFQFFMFSWGGREISGGSNGNTVFDTAYGWAGVWHLGEDAPDTVTGNVYRNSVENANHGNDRVRSSVKTGIIGKGQNFLKGDGIQVANATERLKQPHITVSAWIQLFVADSLGGEVASMGDNYILRADMNARIRLALFSPPDTGYLASCIDTTEKIADSVWHHVSATYDGAEARIFVDGVLKNTISYSGGIPYNGDPDFTIGRHAIGKVGHFFTGNIDEVECASVVRSPDWIKLAFMNQKPDDALVMFGK
jgi:hypothetical protein